MIDNYGVRFVSMVLKERIKIFLSLAEHAVLTLLNTGVKSMSDI